jgi:uncharacterized protein YggE
MAKARLPILLLLTVLLAVALSLAPGPAAAAPPLPAAPAPRTIEVSAEGEAALTPSVGAAGLTVEATARSASKALTQVAAATSKVLDALKEKLGKEGRATTQDYDLFPLYEEEEGRTHLTGYRAVARLRVEVAGTKRLGEVLDAAVNAGASGISGIDFSSPDTSEARRQAAASALKDARRMAERLAAEGGVKLGRLLSVTTGMAPVPQPLRFRAAAMSAEAAPPIEPGELKVRVGLTAVYEIEDTGREK